MTHLGTVPLETNRLLLRPFTIADAPAMYQNYANDPQVTRYLTWPAHESLDTTVQILTEWSASYEKPDYYQWAIVEKDLGQPIGSMAIVRQKANLKEFEVGYCIGAAWWHKGYTSEALQAVIDFLFGKVGIHRFTARHDPANGFSGAVMLHCGMKFEGISRAADTNNQGVCDLSRYAMLHSDWETTKEIAAMKQSPCTFTDFIPIPELRDADLYLVCTNKDPANPEKKYVPAYNFIMCKDGEKIGTIDLRVGYTDGLYYGGNLGYGVFPNHRGKGYAVRACKLAAKIAKAHGMERLMITNNITNPASRRVCEKLDATLLRQATLPPWCELYQGGQRKANIFCWEI